MLQPVSGVGFHDQDTDLGVRGGMIRWTPPLNEGLIAVYRAFLAEDSSGQARLKMDEETAAGTNTMLLPAGTPLSPFQAIVVFTAASLAEQTMPVAFAVSDGVASVKNVSFLGGA